MTTLGDGTDAGLASVMELHSTADLRAAAPQMESMDASPNEHEEPLKPQSVEFKRQSELDAADHFIQQTQFGVVGKKITPFTEQLKREARRFFPIDQDVYDLAQALQREVRSRYASMRFTTLSLFVIFCASTFVIIDLPVNFTKSITATFPPAMQHAWALEIVIVGIILSVVRNFVRWWITKDQRQAVERLSFKVKERYNEILHDCRIAASEIVHMAGEGSWPERAGKLTKVALWFAIRADYLDRFSTTVLWKIDTSFRNDERCFWAAKMSFTAATVLLVLSRTKENFWLGSVDSEHILALITFIVTAVFGWVLVGYRRNNIFSVTFNAAYGGEGARSHYFESFATEIENLVELTERNMWRRGS